MWGNGFQTWKLHSFTDYLMFFGYIAVGIFVFWLVAKHMNRQRNNEKAVEKVSKRLRKLAKKPSCLFEKATLHLPEGDMAFDGILADRSGIYLVKAFGWGTKIYGTPDGLNWRREDPKRKEEFPNPLIELKKGAEAIGAVLEQKGVSRVKIMPMVVFADNFQTPELYLGYGSYSTTYQELKGWYKKQAGVKEAQYDFERVTSILKEIM